MVITNKQIIKSINNTPMQIWWWVLIVVENGGFAPFVIFVLVGVVKNLMKLVLFGM